TNSCLKSPPSLYSANAPVTLTEAFRNAGPATVRLSGCAPKGSCRGGQMRLGNRTRVSVLVSVGFAWVFVAGMLAQSDPQAGVWRLNIAKSKYTTVPSPKSGTTRIEAAGAGTRVVVDQEMSDGSKRHWEFTANYDGKDSSGKGKNPHA